MKKLYLFFILSAGLFQVNTLWALQESEPNNDMQSANLFYEDSVMNGSISPPDDPNDYFFTVPNNDGTVIIHFTYTASKSLDDLYLYAYNKNGNQINTKFLYNVGVSTQNDSLILYGFMQDTLYFRVSSPGSFTYNFSYTTISSGSSDPEPNNSMEQATTIQYSDIVNAHIGYKSVSTDINDYFITRLPTFGTINLYIQYNNTSGSTGSDFYSYIYNKKGTQIGTSFQYNQPLGINYDTITIYCRELDTIYFRFTSSGSFSYQFHYDIYAPNPNDAEPNNAMADANWFTPADTVSGRIGYKSVSTDINDYFFTKLPDDGTLEYIVKYDNTSNSDGSDFYSYIYNKKGAQIGTSFQYNQSLGISYDTIRISCLASDTVYFRITSNGCFSYEFYYNLIPSGISDSEPNNAMADANWFTPADTVSGRIGYKSESPDINDYFFTKLPDEGTLEYIVKYDNTSNSDGSDFYSYVYNKKGAQIGASFQYNQPLGISYDTIRIPCLASDTVYFRITSSGCFSYEFSYQLQTVGSTDAEPNNSFTDAAMISLNDTLKGKIGHASATTDKNDYYKFVIPETSSITSVMTYTNTSGSNGSDFYVSLWRSNGSSFTNDYKYNLALGEHTDTLLFRCLPADTFYLNISSSGCFSYEMVFEVEKQQPKAEIKAFQMGRTLSFKALTSVADSFYWDFDDGNISGLKYPKNTYPIGTYHTTLTAMNSTCKLSVSDTVFVEIKGIEYFTPTKAGNGGDFMMHIYGGGLDTNTVVKLQKGGTVLQPVQKYGSPNRDELQLIFDLHYADEGLYDVIIEIPGEPVQTYNQGLEIEEFKYPYTYSEITGPSRWRINRDTRFVLNVTNTGNVNASGVVTYLIWPKSVEIEFLTEWFRPPQTGTYQVEVEDLVFTWNWADIQPFYDSGYIRPTAIDSFAGKPYDGYMLIILIPTIAPNSVYEIPFLAITFSQGQPEFITYTSKPNLFGSCSNGSYLDMIENLAVESIDAIDMGLGLAKMDKTPVGWLAKAVKGTTKGMANLGQVMGASYNYWTGTTNSLSESLPANFSASVDAQNIQTASAILEVAVDGLMGMDAQNFMKGKTDELNRWMANNPTASLSSFQLSVDQLNNIDALRKMVAKGQKGYKTAKDLNTLNQKIQRLRELAEDCPKLKKQLKDLEKEIDKELHQRDKRKKETRSVISMDPNEIYGPIGIDSDQYIGSKGIHHFLITFENVDTAQADAQIVKVSIPLDTTAFDLNTFSFGDISIADSVYRIPNHRKQFTMDIPLENNVIMVRVDARLDMLTGIVEWTFISLDTVTHNLPVFDGFLPPNVSAPEGEGSVSYSVSLKETAPTGYKIQSQASIIFDENMPVLTNTWVNTIDKSAGTSYASATTNDTLIIIYFDGSDDLSGIDYYYLYISENGGEWLPLSGSLTDSLVLEGEPGQTYSFYSASIDRVGNEEVKSPVAESTVTVTGVKEPVYSSFTIFPNPGNGKFIIRYEGRGIAEKVKVYNLLGKIVYISEVSNPSDEIEISLPDLANGLYSVELINDKGEIIVRKLLILR